MTVSSTLRKAGPFNGNGVTTAFPFVFKVFAKTDIQVVKTSAAGVQAALVLDSDYSVALNADQDNSPGGTVTYPVVGTPLAAGETLNVVGSLTYDQGTDITNLGRFLPQVHENVFDRIVMLAQQLLEKFTRAVSAPVGDTTSMVLPTAGLRARKAVIFDASGNVTVGTEDYEEQQANVNAAAAAAATSASGAAASQSAAAAEADDAAASATSASGSATSAAASAGAAAGSAVAAAGSVTNAAAYEASAAAIAGVTAMYATVAEMTAATGSIAANAFVSVLQDENNQGQSSIYRKVSGAMVYQQYLSYPRKFAAGVSGLRSYPRGSVLVHVGDSISVKGGEWGVGYINGWLGQDGIFEGWTSYNLSSNGSPAAVWAAQIAAGNTAEAPADYDNNLGYNPWAAVNANPDVIVFQLGTNDLRMDSSAGAVTTLRANLAKLVTLFLARTSAHIIMKMPPPIAYANPDPNGFTNCVDATDAANRSASLRTLYLEYANVSNRITVVDLQKHLFGYREDAIGAAMDPEGQGALKKDSLHPTNLGATRTAQIIARIIDPARPYTTAVLATPTQTLFKDALLSTMVNVKASGAGYVDVYADAITQLLGSLTRTYPRGSLTNIKHTQLALLAGSASKFKEILQGFQLQLFYPATGAGATLSNFTASYVAVDGVNDYWHITATGTFAGSGPALAFVASAALMPRRIPDNVSMQIVLGGALPLTAGAASGSACLPLTDTNPLLAATTISGTRQSGTGAASIGLYVSNVWNQSYSGSVTAGVPGYKLGTLNFADGFLQSTTWTADPTNFPGGTASLPDAPSNITTLNAVLASGQLGNYGTVSIRAR